MKLDQLVGSQGSIVTEPRAVATGPLLVEKVSMRQQAGRILHPTRAARAGTPARSRFCNPYIGRPSRESRFRDADSNWAISAVLKIPPDIFAREALANARVSDQLCIGARISTFNGNHVFVLGGRLGGYGRHQFISLRRNRSAPSDYGA